MPKIETKTDIRRNDLFEDVAETIAAQLIKKHEVPEEKAAEIGNALVDFLADHWKKQTIYIPEDWRYKNRKRDQEIYEGMARGNANELAAKFGISMVRVYQIYSRRRAEEREQQQVAAEVKAAKQPNATVL